jgi:hypothetical protein
MGRVVSETRSVQGYVQTARKRWLEQMSSGSRICEAIPSTPILLDQSRFHSASVALSLSLSL